MVGQMEIIGHEQKSAARLRMQQQKQQLVLQHQLSSIGSIVIFGCPQISGGGALKKFLVGGTTRAYY